MEKMETDLRNFLDFWSNPKQKTSTNKETAMYRAYQAATTTVAATKARTSEFLVPNSGGKGGWTPAFDPDRIEEVATLAAEIEQKRKALEAIAKDIGAFTKLVGGPSLWPLANLQTKAIKQLTTFEEIARHTTQIQTDMHPDLLPIEIQGLPEVKKANGEFFTIKAKFESEIADANEKIKQAEKICKIYR